LSTKVLDGNRDQRSHHRYAVTLDLEYKLLKRGRGIQIGSGKTLDISSHGILFQASESFALGGPIELMIRWPFLLEHVCPLKLVIRGRVVRVDDGNRVAVSVTYHEFRTSRQQNARITQRKGAGYEMLTQGRRPQISETGRSAE
jgi:hypothetical protein